MLLFISPEVTSGPCSWQMILLFCSRFKIITDLKSQLTGYFQNQLKVARSIFVRYTGCWEAHTV